MSVQGGQKRSTRREPGKPAPGRWQLAEKMMLGSRTIDENVAHTDSIMDAAERNARGGHAEGRAMARACLLDWTACASKDASGTRCIPWSR